MNRPLCPVPALLIIDAQTWLFEGATKVPSAPTLAARLAQVLVAARQAGSLVIHLQNDGAAGTPEEPGAPGWSIHPSAAPRPGETVLRKTTDDGFEGSHLDDLLSSAGVNRVAVAGLLSEMCVSATIRGALARGLEVVLIGDAHGTYDLEDIPSAVVSRAAEHALGDQLELATAADIVFTSPTNAA